MLTRSLRPTRDTSGTCMALQSLGNLGLELRFSVQLMETLADIGKLKETLSVSTRQQLPRLQQPGTYSH